MVDTEGQGFKGRWIFCNTGRILEHWDNVKYCIGHRAKGTGHRAQGKTNARMSRVNILEHQTILNYEH
ncbi:MAG: hypothetical protein U9N53_05085, partial [Bacteroidota bacterium]|nr:hypothetical protein [Bacteroidota bacterium]